MIKKYRLLRGYTQEQIAELLEVSTRQYQRIESANGNISMKMFRKLIKILKIEDKDILDYIKK